MNRLPLGQAHQAGEATLAREAGRRKVSGWMF
jgi:hypothetical protein